MVVINTLRPRQNGRHFPDDSFKYVFFNENARISLKISMKFVPKVRINNIPALVQIMAWRRPGDKPLSEPMMVSLLTHISVTRPQWVKSLSNLCHIIQSLHLVDRHISWSDLIRKIGYQKGSSAVAVKKFFSFSIQIETFILFTNMTSCVYDFVHEFAPIILIDRPASTWWRLKSLFSTMCFQFSHTFCTICAHSFIVLYCLAIVSVLVESCETIINIL